MVIFVTCAGCLGSSTEPEHLGDAVPSDSAPHDEGPNARAVIDAVDVPWCEGRFFDGSALACTPLDFAPVQVTTPPQGLPTDEWICRYGPPASQLERDDVGRYWGYVRWTVEGLHVGIEFDAQDQGPVEGLIFDLTQPERAWNFSMTGARGFVEIPETFDASGFYLSGFLLAPNDTKPLNEPIHWLPPEQLADADSLRYHTFSKLASNGQFYHVPLWAQWFDSETSQWLPLSLDHWAIDAYPDPSTSYFMNNAPLQWQVYDEWGDGANQTREIPLMWSIYDSSPASPTVFGTCVFPPPG